jgi:uncharacterized membrane protein
LTVAESGHVAVLGGASPVVRQVAIDRPWQWLALGWEDLRRSARVGLVYGGAFVAVGLGIAGGAAASGHYEAILPFAAGLPLVAPVLVIGLYEVSRKMALGEPVDLSTPIGALSRNRGQAGVMGFVLGLIFLAWMRLATLIFAVFFGISPPSLEAFLTTVVFSGANLAFLACGTLVGALLAVLVFSISVVSVPMLLDRGADVFTAMATSVATVRANPRPMLLWACLIVLFVGAGTALLLIGLIVVLPLIAHASWHAYRDVVAFEPAPTQPADPAPATQFVHRREI